MQRFGEKLHALRLSYGMTLKQLAIALGYTAHGHLSEIESGKKKPTVDLVLNVARLFKVSTDELLKDEMELPLYSATKDRVGMTSLAFIHRPPTPNELERLRLVLSTYQDGTGQYTIANNQTLPGWRDFERTVALVFGGEAPENKGIFDVLMRDTEIPVQYGISCKMRGELERTTRRTGRVYLELSSSSKQFWDALSEQGIDQSNYASRSAETGVGIIRVVASWHEAAYRESGGLIDLTNSYYLSLQYDKKSGVYQLYQFPLTLPNPNALLWQVEGQRLIGYEDNGGVLFEWYGHSGGQLKYYPKIQSATWISIPFHLEPLPEQYREHGILRRAAEYFPILWAQANRAL